MHMYRIFTKVQTFELGKIFLNVPQTSILCSPMLHIFDQKYSKNSNIVKYYYNVKELFSEFEYFNIL